MHREHTGKEQLDKERPLRFLIPSPSCFDDSNFWEAILPSSQINFALKRKKREQFDSRQYERSCGLLSLGNKEMQDGGWVGVALSRKYS